MSERKGQHLFNGISKKHYLLEHQGIDDEGEQYRIPYVNLHNILFNMPDEEFGEIMKSLEHQVKEYT